MGRISVAQPWLAGNERRYIIDCLDTNWISSAGKYIAAFEEAFASFCGVRHAIATNNGTTALHLALVGLDLKPGEEVILPTVTYVATANAVHYCGGIPVIVDVAAPALNIDPAAIEARITERTRGIIAVHLYGHPAEMAAINAIARRHGLWVVEDAAEAHGALAEGRMVGGLSDVGVFSFFGNKIITTGEGGMVTTNDDGLAARLRLYRGQGMDPDRRYWFPVVGYNYRMTNIQAAIGLAQLEQVDSAIADRQQLAAWYNEALADLGGELVLPVAAPWARHVFWMYTVFLRSGDAARRDAVMSVLNDLDIETRPVFYPLHILPPYLDQGAYPVADLWAMRGISLPTHQALTRSDVDRVARALRQALAGA